MLLSLLGRCLAGSIFSFQNRLIEDPKLHIVISGICTQHFAIQSTIVFSELEFLMSNVCCDSDCLWHWSANSSYSLHHLRLLRIRFGMSILGDVFLILTCRIKVWWIFFCYWLLLMMIHLSRISGLHLLHLNSSCIILIVETLICCLFKHFELVFEALHHDFTWLCALINLDRSLLAMLLRVNFMVQHSI